MIKKINNNTKKGENNMIKKIDNNTKKGENNMIKKITVPILSATLLFGAGTLGVSAMMDHTAPAAPISSAITADQLLEAFRNNDPNFREQLDTFIKNGGDITATDKYGTPFLHYAVESQNPTTVQTLIEKITPENALHIFSIQDDEYGIPFLHYAVEFGNPAIVQTLLEKITPENALQIFSIQDERGMPFLYYAFEFKNPAIVQPLLEKITPENALQIFSIQDERRMPFPYYAFESENPDIIQALIENITPENALQIFSIQDKYGHTPLYYAFKFSNTEAAKMLIEKIPNKNVLQILNIQNKYGRTLLHYAFKFSNTEATKMLLKNITPENVLQILNIQDKNGRTPLHYAFKFSNTETTKMLLEKIPPDNVKFLNLTDNKRKTAKMLLEKIPPDNVKFLNLTDNKGKTPLYFAVKSEAPDLVLALLNAGADPKITDRNGKTPLYLAMEKGYTDTIVNLIKKNIEDNKLSPFGTDDKQKKILPIHWAAEFGRVGILKGLLRYGPNLDERDECNMTPLHISIKHNHLDAATVLIKQIKTANNKESILSAVDKKRGWTPLHWAVVQANIYTNYPKEFQECVETATLLLNAGADPRITDCYGITPIDFAKKIESKTVSNTLLQKMQAVTPLSTSTH